MLQSWLTQHHAGQKLSVNFPDAWKRCLPRKDSLHICRRALLNSMSAQDALRACAEKKEASASSELSHRRAATSPSLLRSIQNDSSAASGRLTASLQTHAIILQSAGSKAIQNMPTS